MAENRRFLPEISMVIIVGVVLIILAAGIAYFVATQVVGSNETAETVSNGENDVVEYTGITFPLGEFTTNLADEGGRRIFQVDITLELSSSDVKSEIEHREPQINDNVYTIMRSMTTEALSEQEGMEELKDKIKDSINDRVTEGEVVNVYFNRPLIT